MRGTVDGFNYGIIIPITAYLVACLGSGLGLRCVARTMHHERGWRPGWLALGAASLGCGIWSMHFIAMAGFSVVGTEIAYDVDLTLLSLLVAVVVVGVGVFIVGYSKASPLVIGMAGTLTGLGVVSMHYMGMSAMHLHGNAALDTFTVLLSVVVAVTASTTALWAVVTVRRFVASVGASLVMAAAVTGMHYTGMAAVSVQLHAPDPNSRNPIPLDGEPLFSLLFPMLIGPGVFFLIATVTVMFDPVLIVGRRDWDQPGARAAGASEPPRSPASQEYDLFGSPIDRSRGGDGTLTPVAARE
ncbi:MHYT domain-containing protein [Streptomyces zaomyceticus]|uniref:MHYT domain-containing protein n=1 Tax=Streptomyces zaomyceticus TaxID=68286 RepID=UPI003693FEA9